jgi:hypothetical protein
MPAPDAVSELPQISISGASLNSYLIVTLYLGHVYFNKYSFISGSLTNSRSRFSNPGIVDRYP